MRRWEPEAELERLLDALEADILSASVQEIHIALFEGGCSLERAARQVRRVVANVDHPRDGPGFDPYADETPTSRAFPRRTHLM
jgi:hypothetical protein